MVVEQQQPPPEEATAAETPTSREESMHSLHVKKAEDAYSIGSGGIDSAMPEAKTVLANDNIGQKLLSFLTSIRTERAFRFIAPIPLLVWMSYKPVPQAPFSHMCIVLYCIQAALLPPVVTMVPIILFCALPAAIMGLGMTTLLWFIWSELGDSVGANVCVVIVSFFYFLLASNLRLGPFANLMTICYYAMVYSVEFASIMGKAIMSSGVAATSPPIGIEHFIPGAILQFIPKEIIAWINALPIQFNAMMSEKLLQPILHFRGVHRFVGVLLELSGSLGKGLTVAIPRGMHFLRYAWEGEPVIGVVSAIVVWAFISYAAFIVTMFIPPVRTGTSLYKNALGGCHGILAANVLDWIARCQKPSACEPMREDAEFKQLFPQKTAAVRDSAMIDFTTQSLASLTPRQPRSRKQTILVPTDIQAALKQTIQSASSSEDQGEAHLTAEDDKDEYNPYYGYDITRHQSLSQAVSFASNSNISKVISNYPSYANRFNLTLQSLNTMRSPLMLSVFETFAVNPLGNTSYNMGNDIPERLRLGAELEGLATGLYLIQMHSALTPQSAPPAPPTPSPLKSALKPIARVNSPATPLFPLTPELSEKFISTNRPDISVSGASSEAQKNAESRAELHLPPPPAGSAADASGAADLDRSSHRPSNASNSPTAARESNVDAYERGTSRVSFQSTTKGSEEDVLDSSSSSSGSSSSRSSRSSYTKVSKISSRRTSETSNLSCDFMSRSSFAQAKSETRSPQRDVKPPLRSESKIVNLLQGQRNKNVQFEVGSKAMVASSRSSYPVVTTPVSIAAYFGNLLLSCYHTLRLSESNGYSKRALNESFAERKILRDYKKMQINFVADNGPLCMLYRTGIINPTLNVLNLRKEGYISLRTNTWKRTGMTAGTIIMGLPLYFYCLISPWLNSITSAKKLNFQPHSVSSTVELSDGKTIVTRAGPQEKDKYVMENASNHLLTIDTSTHMSERLLRNSNLWYALRLAIGNTMIFSLGVFLERWRTLNITGKHSFTMNNGYVNIEQLMGTRYAAWACIGFITTITETTHSCLKRAMLRGGGVIAGTISAYLCVLISAHSWWVHSLWLMVTCFVAVWLTAHPANPAIGFDPSWGYAAQLFTYQQIIIMSLVALNSFDIRELVVARLIAQLIGISTAVLVSYAFFPTIPKRYVRYECRRALEYLNRHLELLDEICQNHQVDQNRAIAHEVLKKANQHVVNARRCLSDNELFVQFRWLNVSENEVSVVEALERLCKIRQFWAKELEGTLLYSYGLLCEHFLNLRLLTALVLASLRSKRNKPEADMYQSLHDHLLREILSKSKLVSPLGEQWSAEGLGKVCMPIEAVELHRTADILALVNKSP